MLQRLIAEQQVQNFDWTPLNDISPWMALAAVAGEDQTFPDHPGVDLHALSSAVSDRLKGQPLRGASTISQQVARNVFLWQGRSFVRKGLELYFTVLIELFWSKKRILEVYLNVAETGPQLFGVEAASRQYFKIAAKDLSAEQSALIAAVLPNPIAYRIEAPSTFVRQRQQWIGKQMTQLGGLAYLKDVTP